MSAPQVVIVGDGPAGCAAAIACARCGLATILVSAGSARQAIPETVHGVIDLFESLGVDRAQDSYVGEPLEDGRRHLRRDILDPLLQERARASGTVILNGRARSLKLGDLCRVIVGDHAIEGDVVIDAAGSSQWLQRQTNAPRRHGSAQLLCCRGLARGAEALRKPKFLIGDHEWLWFAPIASGQAVWTHVTCVTGRSSPSLPAGWEIDGVVHRAARPWSRVRNIAGPNYIVAGDAAGHLDPASGDGVTLALQSGRNAAITAARIIANPRTAAVSARQYEQWWMRILNGRMRVLAAYYARVGLAEFLESPARVPSTVVLPSNGP